MHRVTYTPTNIWPLIKNENETRLNKDINTESVVKKRKNCCFKKRTIWRRKWLNPKVLIPLLILNITGPTSAVEEFTSRVIASIFGYPSSCTVGNTVKPCTLSISCWLRGGNSGKGCGGGWILTCCEDNVEYGEETDALNAIPYKYKSPRPSPRPPPRRGLMSQVAFRRRVDDEDAHIGKGECGVPSSSILQKRIIGGREAKFAEFPWQAHVRISEYQCGGVLVSRWFVATAAHCVVRAGRRDVRVWLGATDTASRALYTTTATQRLVIQKILHPMFQFRMTQPDRYDIALLRLSRPITYKNHILPICLPDSDLDLRGKMGVIAGWGKTDTSNGHTGTNLLRSATVPILSTEQCIKWHRSKQISVEIHSEMICAGHSDGHQDACLGDSGGPLIVLDSGRYYLVGITSAGFGCGVDHQPGIYHNVLLTADWMKMVIAS